MSCTPEVMTQAEASGSVQEVSHAEMQSRFAEVSRFSQTEVSQAPEVMTHAADGFHRRKRWS